MRVVVVYKQNDEFTRQTEDYIADVKRQTGQDLEVINPETVEGEMFCRAYDIVEYPTVIAIASNGMMQSMWRGTQFPTISEVGYYAGQN